MHTRALARKALAIAILLLAVPSAAPAHIIAQGMGMQSYLKVERDRVYLEYNLGFSEFAGFSEALKMDANKNGTLEAGEIEAWLDAMQRQILSSVLVTLDGEPVVFTLMKRQKWPPLMPGVDLREINGLAFDTWWYFESDTALPPGAHEFVIRDHNFESEISQSLIWFGQPVPLKYRTFYFETEPASARVIDVGTDWQIYARGATLHVEFPAAAYAPTGTATATSATVTPTASATTVAPSPSMLAAAQKSAKDAGVTIQYRGAEENEEARRLVGLRKETWYLALAIALFWGAAHALAPGHGKSLVAAYLLGSKGRILDAVTAGGAATLSHSIGNFGIAALVLGAMHLAHINPNTLVGTAAITTELACGAIIFCWGTWILYGRLQGIGAGLGHDHGNHHHHHGVFHAHDHGHVHEHRAGDPSGFALGFLAGFQPCSAGIMLVFISIAQGWAWRGLYLLLAFSLGLGVVIVAIAILTVTAQAIVTDNLGEKSRLVRALPVISSALLTVVGAYIILDALMRNKVGPFAGS